MTIDNKKFEIALANSGLTVEQAAKRAGISRQRYCMILNQKNVLHSQWERLPAALA